MMVKKWKTKWIKALLSGKYKQAESTLKDEDGRMCCLGVLRDVRDPDDEGSRKNKYDSGAYLNTGQWREFGLTHKQQEKLAEMNDEGVDFPTIADYIKRNL